MQLLLTLVILGVQGIVYASNCQLWKRVDDISFYMLHVRYLSTHTTVYTAIECARLCCKEPQCAAFLYTAAPYRCQLYKPSYDTKQNSVDPTALLYASEHREYELALVPQENVTTEAPAGDECTAGATEVTDGSIDYGSNTEPYSSGTTATVHCDPGYTIVSVSGFATITCTAGSWGDMLPTCAANDCTAVATEVTDGSIDYGSNTAPYASGTTATVNCNSGYTIVSVSGFATITCTAGSWGEMLPTCAANDCTAGATDVTDGSIDYGSNSAPYASGTTATVNCNSGYTISGSATITCTAGSWTAVLPTCAASGPVPGNISEVVGDIAGTLDSADIDHVAGMAASRRHPGMLYVHNDNGETKIYVISGTGAINATLQITGVPFKDCEDMAVAKCTRAVDSKYCMYLGDVGDQNRGDAAQAVYRIQEPEVLQDQTINVAAADVLQYTWEEEPLSETILVDPDTNVYIISKNWGNDGKIALLPDSGWGSNSTVVIPDGLPRINVTKMSESGPKAGDISANGDRIIMKTKEALYYWYTNGSRDYVTILQTPGTEAPYIYEDDGEAVCWDANGEGYFTIAKGDNPDLYYYV